MITQTGTIIQTRYQQTGHVPPKCLVTTRHFSGSFTADSKLEDSRSPKREGNRIVALPYFRRVIEPVTMAGRLAYSYSGGTPLPVCALIGAPDGGHSAGSIPAAAICRVPKRPELSFSEPEWARLIASAETKALSNARNSYMNVPLLVAERKQTITMVAQRVQKLTRGAADMQSRAVKEWYAASKSQKGRIAQKWAGLHLEALFGWLPLIDEIYGLVDVLTQTESVSFYARGKHASDVSQSSTVGTAVSFVNVGGYVAQVPSRRVIETNTRQSARVSLLYRVDISGYKELRELGFNPMAAAFDLIPASFLLNFASNVGTYLRSYDPMIGASFVTGSCSTWGEVSEMERHEGTSMTTSTERFECQGVATATRRGILLNRTVYKDEPSGTFQFQNNLTLSKAATVASLGIQRLIKPARRLFDVKQFRYRGPRPKYLPPIRYR